MKFSARSLGLGVAVAVVSVLPFLVVSAEVEQPGSRKNAPAFSLKDANGASVKLSNYKGKVLLLDFWATWCAGCKIEIPWFMEFQQKYGSKGLAAIGVAMDEEGWKLVRPYLAEHPISYPIVMGTFSLLQTTFRLPPSLPITLLIDRNGKIAETHVGLVEKDAFERDVQRLLQEETR